MARGVSRRRQPFHVAISFTGVPGGSVATTGEASDGAKRSTTGRVAGSPASSADDFGFSTESFTDTLVFSVLAASVETNVSFSG